MERIDAVCAKVLPFVCEHPCMSKDERNLMFGMLNECSQNGGFPKGAIPKVAKNFSLHRSSVLQVVSAENRFLPQMHSSHIRSWISFFLGRNSQA
jgi:hypothetical protein